jgi:hypothetical protein
MKTVQFESEVGSDGFVSLRVPLGVEEANSRVIVTIAPLPTTRATREPQTDWQEFVKQTYGSCAELGLEEPQDLPLQSREAME